MNIDLDLEQLIELNQIRGLLKSPDFESQVLGFEMFKNSSLFKNKIYDLCYETKNGKQIPLCWYIKKAESIISNKVNRNNSELAIEPLEENFVHLVLPIIESVLLCEARFVGRIAFNTNKFTLMKNYTPESIFNRYMPARSINHTTSIDATTMGCQN